MHQDCGITTRHFWLFVDHQSAKIEAQVIGEAEAREVIGLINTFANEITGTSC